MQGKYPFYCLEDMRNLVEWNLIKKCHSIINGVKLVCINGFLLERKHWNRPSVIKNGSRIMVILKILRNFKYKQK